MATQTRAAMKTDFEKFRLRKFVDRLEAEGYVIRFTEFHLHPGDPKQAYALRISTHLFHDQVQVDRVVDAMHEIYRKTV